MLTSVLIAFTYVAQAAGVLVIVAVPFTLGRWWE